MSKSKLTFTRALFLALTLWGLFSWAQTVQAATYYVAPNGSDSNPGTEAQPWLTLYNSCEKLYPGDTLLVKNGTYASRTRSEWYRPGIEVTRSGTQSQPIIVKAYPGHIPVIDGRTANHFAIGTYGRSWVVFDGLKLLYAMISIHSSSNITIQNLDVEYGQTDPGDSSGTHLIRIEGSSNVLVRNNKIYKAKYKDPSYGFNKAAIMLYGNNSTILEYNEIYENIIAYRDKCGGTCPSNTNIVRYNVFRDNIYFDIFLGGYNTASQNDQIYQNVFLNNTSDANIFISNGNPGTRIYNNVFYWDSNNPHASQSAVWFTSFSSNTNVQIYNNIMRGIRSPISIESPVPSGLFVDYNSYSNYNNFYYNWSWITFSQFRTNVGNNNYVQNNVNPLFVDPANRNFRLQSNSPARSAGINGVNMGAYITGNETIGLLSEVSSDTTPPAAPGGLSVQ